MPSSVICEASVSKSPSDMSGATVTHSLASDILVSAVRASATSGITIVALNSSDGAAQEMIKISVKRLIEYLMGVVFNKKNV